MRWRFDPFVRAGLFMVGLCLGGDGTIQPAWAGPNAGGTLLAHDTGLAFTSLSETYHSPPPSLDPPTVDANVSPGFPLGGLGWVWKVYAAFPNGSMPRLRGLGFMSVFSSDVTVFAAGLPDGESGTVTAQDGWPTLNGGSAAINFDLVGTAQVDEVYWFAGYGEPAGGSWSTAPHASAASRCFWDDAWPAHQDAIAGYSSIGFGVDGHTELPREYGELGACCFAADGRCETIFSDLCSQAGGSVVGGPCEPNPCPPPSQGACCYVSGTCRFVYAPDCPTDDWRADVPCDPNPCSQPTGDKGETMEDALLIASIPFSDSRTTCGYADDYDAVCPSEGSTASDRVYRYAPTQDEILTVDLCASSYDTKVHVYRNGADHLIACNDDAWCGYSGWQSKIMQIPVTIGDDYYIVIDGYREGCGDYVLNVHEYQPCVLTCPDGARLEGEAGCYDGYFDDYDGGCNGGGWIAISPQAGGCADYCGTSCTYMYEGLNYRDTDWYSFVAVGGPITITATAEFPFICLLFLSTNCNDLSYVYEEALECTPVTLTWDAGSGDEMWLWIAPSTFTGVPEADYTFRICGVQGEPVPIREMSWGRLKESFRYPSARGDSEASRAEMRSRPVGMKGSPGGSPGVDRPSGIFAARAPVKEPAKPK